MKTQSVSEVTDFLKDAVDQNVIDKEAEFIARKAIKLGDITVKEIMIPKVDMVTIHIDENTTDIITKIIESGHSRYPVLGKERNDVAGVLLAKDILPKLFKGITDFDIIGMLRDPNVVPETKKADSLLEEFKQDRSHLAVVIDEYGEISGLVTIEDILEELVGEIERTEKYLEKGIVEIAPLAYMRGRTLNNSFIIVDESQNTTKEQMKMILTRMGFGSYLLINGDLTQIDLPKNIESGLAHAVRVVNDTEDIGVVNFDSNVLSTGVGNAMGLSFITGPSSRRVGLTLKATF